MINSKKFCFQPFLVQNSLSSAEEDQSKNLDNSFRLNQITFQLFNAGWNASLAMLPKRCLLSPVLKENMKKGVIICKQHKLDLIIPFLMR